MTNLNPNNPDDQKTASGAIATIVWIIGTIYLFWQHLSVGELFTLKGLGFLFVGMFVAALLIGSIAYTIQNFVTKILLQNTSDFNITKGKQIFISIVGIFLLFLEILIAWIAVRYGFELVFGF